MSGREAIETLGVDCLVLDDAFQHRQLSRDLDLVLIDATCPFGNGRALPAGLLREPLTSLRRAGVFVLSRCDQCPSERIEHIRRTLLRYSNRAPVVEGRHGFRSFEEASTGRAYDAKWVVGKRALAFCGLGNPKSFFWTLEQLGVELTGVREFPDHYRYDARDADELERLALDCGAEIVLTTQKDRVKLERDALRRRPLLTLKIEFEITRNQAALEAAVTAALGNVSVNG